MRNNRLAVSGGKLQRHREAVGLLVLCNWLNHKMLRNGFKEENQEILQTQF